MTIKLDGKPLSDFGIDLLSPAVHPAAPQTRDVTVYVPGRAGVYHFGSTLGERNFAFECGLIRELDTAELQRRLRELVAFLLDSYARPREIRLTFDYEPDKYYAVKFVGQITPERFFALGSFTLTFTAFDPMAKSVVTSDQIIMDSDTPIIADISMDTDGSSRQITAPITFTVINNGSTAIRYSYQVLGSGTDVTLSANGKTFGLGTFSEMKIIVYGETYVVTRGDLPNLAQTSGDFIELLPGANEITVNGSAMNFTISESLTYKYV